MHTKILVSVMACTAIASAAFADDNRPAGGERQWLSIPQAHAKLEAAGYRNIEKIEREHGRYEVKATDRTGARVKLYLHPQTGDVIDQRGRETRRDRYDKSDGRSLAPGQRSAADCNERRCRDDLPQPAAATPPAAK